MDRYDFFSSYVPCKASRIKAILQHDVELDTWQRTHLDFISQSNRQDFDRL